ncbi:MAG: bifunctional oligoribonuclease/PAP phosphatase NrnA [Firmicutes bacterium]|nr:bifunctional oligoribonuclease/PAP phosphatase NrnA [Bacillota bacterium]
MNTFKQIYKLIKKYNKIVIARHIGADPDALGSTLGLKEVILNTFPKKQVYVVGTPAAKHKYIGILDKFNENMYEDSLLIVLDTPNAIRIDGVDINKFEYKIKIDHHPFIEKFADIELIDETSSSASQLVVELVVNTKLKINKEAAEKLFIGIVGDTNRFMYYYTTPKTFELVSYMIKETNLEFTNLYENMYIRSLHDLRFQSYVINNLTLTDEGFGYIRLEQDILDEYGIDAATATNVVNGLTYIEDMYAWAIFAYDKSNDNIRGSIRSRGPIINDIASNYNGGGHIYASGIRVKDFETIDLLINDLNEVCKEYKEKKNI